MLLIFQILFTIFILVTLVTVYKRRSQSVLGPKGAKFWILFWIVAGIAVWWPDATSQLAKLLGIGRGVDLVLYISIVVLFFLLFRLHIKIESIGRDITKLTREQALIKTKQDKKN